MDRILTVEQMTFCEHETEKYGVSLAQLMDNAAALGSFTLGSTALLAGYKKSERGIIARDVIDALPRFLYDLENAD